MVKNKFKELWKKQEEETRRNLTERNVMFELRTDSVTD
jgi:hypothetical protein